MRISDWSSDVCSSDLKLSEFARMGYVPSAVHCTPAVSSTSSSKWGTWYIDKAVADRLVKDRQAGRPMPWHAKPLLDNLRVTYRLWTKRKHPPSCKTRSEEHTSELQSLMRISYAVF